MRELRALCETMTTRFYRRQPSMREINSRPKLELNSMLFKANCCLRGNDSDPTKVREEGFEASEVCRSFDSDLTYISKHNIYVKSCLLEQWLPIPRHRHSHKRFRPAPKLILNPIERTPIRIKSIQTGPVWRHRSHCLPGIIATSLHKTTGPER
jgi:hypothetical protein